MQPYLKLMRVHHYIKNLLLFAALVCSGLLFCREKLLACLSGFAAFCFLSSAVYVVNDIRDVQKDRLHPVKRSRPLASGEISVPAAKRFALGLLLASVLCNALVFHWSSTVLLLLYLGINLAYSFGCKNIPIADVAILAGGFLIRAMYGAVITDISLSSWLYLTVMVFALYFALGKRRNELRQQDDGQTRPVLRAYSASFLDRQMTICLALGHVFYSLWSVDEKTRSFYGNDYLIATVPLVFLITMRYSLTIDRSGDGDPVSVLLTDKPLLAMCLLYGAIMLALLYL